PLPNRRARTSARARGSAHRTVRRRAPAGSGDPPLMAQPPVVIAERADLLALQLLRILDRRSHYARPSAGADRLAEGLLRDRRVDRPGVVDASGSELCARAPIANRVARTKIAAALDHIAARLLMVGALL